MFSSDKSIAGVSDRRHQSSSPFICVNNSEKTLSRTELLEEFGQLDQILENEYGDQSVYRTITTPASFMSFSPIRLSGRPAYAARPNYPSQQLNPLRERHSVQDRYPLNNNDYSIPLHPQDHILNLSEEFFDEEVPSSPSDLFIKGDEEISHSSARVDFESIEGNDHPTVASCQVNFPHEENNSFDGHPLAMAEHRTSSVTPGIDIFSERITSLITHDSSSKTRKASKVDSCDTNYFEDHLGVESYASDQALPNMKVEFNDLMLNQRSFPCVEMSPIRKHVDLSIGENDSCFSQQSPLHSGKDTKRLTVKIRNKKKTNETMKPKERKMRGVKPSKTLMRGHQPSDLDILRGRGGLTNRHAGNMKFRDEARKLRAAYRDSTTTRKEKFEMSKVLVERVKRYGGKFLEKGENDLWIEMSEKAARKKASQVLREEKWD